MVEKLRFDTRPDTESGTYSSGFQDAAYILSRLKSSCKVNELYGIAFLKLKESNGYECELTTVAVWSICSVLFCFVFSRRSCQALPASPARTARTGGRNSSSRRNTTRRRRDRSRFPICRAFVGYNEDVFTLIFTVPTCCLNLSVGVTSQPYLH